MNNKYIYTPKQTNPNKTKKCSCENKVGPKPFTNNQKETKSN